MNRNMTDGDSLAEAIDVIKGCKAVGCEWCEKKIAVVIRDAVSEKDKEIERLRHLVEKAFNEGFGEGMNDVLRQSGGTSWYDSRSRKAIRNRNTGE